MAARAVVQNIMSFVSGVLQRDRYLPELGASFVTLLVGIIASNSGDALDDRQALSGFRDMPCPEMFVILFALPGIWSSIKLWREGERHEGIVSLLVMASFVVLSCASMALDLRNWAFWTLFALQLGVLKGYALILEWSYLRWGVSCLGSFFWISLTLSILQNAEGPTPILLAPCIGFAGFNLLSVWRARGKRNG